MGNVGGKKSGDDSAVLGRHGEYLNRKAGAAKVKKE